MAIDDIAIPASPLDIGAAWLSAALADRHPGARVAEVEVLEHDEVTNSHVLLQVAYDEPAGAPSRLFGKLLPDDPLRRGVIAATDMGVREARFYALLAPTIAMRVPVMHVAKIAPDGAFAVLVEDLGDTGCRVSDGTWGIAPDAAAAALRDLAELHARFEHPARRESEAPWVPRAGPGTTYAVERLAYALEHHRDRLSDEFVAVAELYNTDRAALHALWTDGPLTVIHGDAHIGNLFDDHGTTGFYDWGMINVGSPMREVSYFLNMAMQIDDRRAHERDLLREYLGVRRALGASDITWDRAWHAHRLQSAYCVPASCQVVTFPDGISEERRVFADAFLARAEAAVNDLEAAAAVREALGE